MNAAHMIKGAMKTGKATAGAAKGAAAAGPYGAIAAGLWQSRKLVGKIIAAAAFILFLPILFVLMLPSIIFGNLSEGSDFDGYTNIMNDNAAIMQNINDIEKAVGTILRESHSAVLAAIEAEKPELTENIIIEITDGYSDDIFFNANLIISQYCAFRDNYEDISINDLIKIINAEKDNLFSFVSETEQITKTDEEGNEIIITKITYTVIYAGDSYFADNIFKLTEEQADLARQYAENLSLFLDEDFISQSAAIHKSLNDLLITYPYEWTDDGFHSPFADMDWQPRVTSEYGSRIDPISGAAGVFHAGIDIAYPRGTPIRAAKSGIVIVSEKKTTGYGNRIVINHGGGYATLYAHCHDLLASAGDTVNAGDIIATVGSTGRSTGNHLHFEVILDGVTQDPRGYIG